MIEKFHFHVADYLIFCAILTVSAIIGIIFAIKERKGQTSDKFLHVSRVMSAPPLAMSLVASFMSAITVLGFPKEIYVYGAQFSLIFIAFCFVMTTVAYVFLPVFYELNLFSVYDYLEKRFCTKVSSLGSFLFIIQMIIYMGLVLYAPALALDAVTDLGLWVSICSIGMICTFYTAIGGLKAVIWIDVFQFSMMVIGLFASIIQGFIESGGIAKSFDVAIKGRRLEFFNMDTDPRIRHSFWSVIFGGYFMWLSVYGVNQAQIQRYMCAKSLRVAQAALFLNLAGLFMICGLATLVGMVIYSVFINCDPYQLDLISSYDQIYPLFVIKVLGKLPGLPGLFLACVFSAALSTVSAGLNSITTVVMDNYVKKYLLERFNLEKYGMILSKVLIIICGTTAIGLAALSTIMDAGILQAALALFGVIGGPLLGLFIFGMSIPFGNSFGAFCGVLSSLILISWVWIGGEVNKIGRFTVKPPMSMDQCMNSTYFNLTQDFIDEKYSLISLNTTIPESSGVVNLYRLSYLYYCPVAIFVMMTIGIISSIIFNRMYQKNYRCTDSKLFFKFLRKYIDRPSFTTKKSKVDETLLTDMGEVEKPFLQNI
ncbi:hypothetical protein SNEBB_006400 [Seison nebaliae]|nr:hypothetical protein SNEBB_006400 [Seison nebaliae]